MATIVADPKAFRQQGATVAKQDGKNIPVPPGKKVKIKLGNKRFGLLWTQNDMRLKDSQALSPVKKYMLA